MNSYVRNPNFNISLRTPPSEGNHMSKITGKILFCHLSLLKSIVFQGRGLKHLYTFLSHSFLSYQGSWIRSCFWPELPAYFKQPYLKIWGTFPCDWLILQYYQFGKYQLSIWKHLSTSTWNLAKNFFLCSLLKYLQNSLGAYFMYGRCQTVI